MMDGLLKDHELRERRDGMMSWDVRSTIHVTVFHALPWTQESFNALQLCCNFCEGKESQKKGTTSVSTFWKLHTPC